MALATIGAAPPLSKRPLMPWWTPWPADMADPLAGQRAGLLEGKLTRLRWPGDEECPVAPGDRFTLRSCEVVIEKVERRLVKGRPPEWQATFIRLEPDRRYLLRRNPPVHPSPDLDTDLSMAERARRDGNYTASSVAAIPQEPESVGPDWIDKEAPARELARQNERKDAMDEAQNGEEIRRLKARVTQVASEAGRAGRDLTPLLDDIYQRLAEEEREVRQSNEG